MSLPQDKCLHKLRQSYVGGLYHLLTPSTVIIALSPAGAVSQAAVMKLKLPRPAGLTTPLVQSSGSRRRRRRKGGATTAPSDDVRCGGEAVDMGLLSGSARGMS